MSTLQVYTCVSQLSWQLCYSIPWPKTIVGVDMRCGKAVKLDAMHLMLRISREINAEHPRSESPSCLESTVHHSEYNSVAVHLLSKVEIIFSQIFIFTSLQHQPTPLPPQLSPSVWPLRLGCPLLASPHINRLLSCLG